MFYKTIIGNRLQTILIIFLIALGIWIPSFLSPEIITPEESENAMPFYSLTLSFLEGHILLSKILSFTLMLFAAFLLVRINANFVLIQQRTFLPALFFIIMAGHNPELLQWNPVLPASVFVILLLGLIFRSYGDDPDSYRYFEAGIILGLGSLFYAPLVYLLFFIWLATMVQRPFYWREYLYPVLGIMVPFVFVFALIFFTDKSIPEFFLQLKSNFIFEIHIPEYSWVYWVFAIYIAILLSISTVYLLKVFQFRKIYIRDYFQVLFWLFITGSVIFLAFSAHNNGITYLIAVSTSYMLTNYFINAKQNTGNKLLLYLLLIFALFLAVNNFVAITQPNSSLIFNK
jgi:hypothetical protein